MSLFSTLNTAVRGLHASQTGIDVTGQNISNANTEGYSRKRVSLVPGVQQAEGFGQIGTGVEVSEISRVRDTFIDQQTHEQLGGKGYYTQLDQTLARLENIFKEPFEGSFNESMNTFFNSWQDLANNPSDLAAREAVKSAGASLGDLFHSASNEMMKYRMDSDDLLKKKVEEVNYLTGRIADLNKEISSIESQEGFKANDSRDQRDLMVRQVSQLMDIHSIEDEWGNVSLSSGGALLVGPAGNMPMETFSQTFTRPDGVQFSTLGIRQQEGRKMITPLSGEIRGILDTKERVVPEYEQSLDTLADGLTREVNAIHQTGYSLNKVTGLNFFDASLRGAANFRLSDAIANDSKNIAAAKGGTSVPANYTPIGGIPAALTPTLDLKTVDPRYRYLAKDSVKITLFPPGGPVLQEGAGKDYIVDPTLGTIRFLNYSRFAAGDAISIDFRFEQNGYPGNGDGSNALNLAQLRQNPTLAPDTNGAPTQSFTDFYGAMIGTLGTARNQNTTSLEIKDFLVKQMDEEQATVAGVSLDEEMTNLIKYQHSYQASARIVSTVQEMMDVLMNI